MEHSYSKISDYGPKPYIVNVECMAKKNAAFRTAIWTGCHLQMTLMCIPPCEDIGMEMHEHVDQMLRQIIRGERFIVKKEMRRNRKSLNNPIENSIMM